MESPEKIHIQPNAHDGWFEGETPEVTQYNKQGVIMKVWSCMSEASRELGISVSSISNCIKGLSKTAGGFIWKS